MNQQKTNKERKRWLSVSKRDHSFSAPQMHNQFIMSVLAFVKLGFIPACHDSVWLQRRVWFTEAEHQNTPHNNQTERASHMREERLMWLKKNKKLTLLLRETDFRLWLVDVDLCSDWSEAPVAAPLYMELLSGSRGGFGSFGRCWGRGAAWISVNFSKPVGSLEHPTGYKKAQIITCFYQSYTK